MGYSVKIHFRKDAIRKDGTCSIYLQIIIDRKKKVIPLNIAWPAELCSDTQSLCMTKEKGNNEADDINIILRDSLAKGNEILRILRMSRQAITIDSFMSNWHNEFSRHSFTAYYEQKMKFRFQTGDISLITYKNYGVTLNWLKEFKKDIGFSDFNEKWAFKFDAFLAKKIKSRDGQTHNSRWGYHKNIKTMLNMARKFDKIPYTNPYEYFQMQANRGTWGAINQADIQALYEYYRETKAEYELRALRRFFFAVATSLRVSDITRANKSWKEGQVLRFTAKKNEKKKPKRMEIPMSTLAMQVWDEAMAKAPSHGRPFDNISEQYSNRILRKIGEKLGITTRLHHHVGRHSWTTNFLNNGGSIRTAQKILNHYSIKTTMIYDHMDFNQVLKEKEKMEFLKTDTDPESH